MTQMISATSSQVEPPADAVVLSAEEAATLLRISLSTLYDWRSQGRLDGTFRKRGKRLLFHRERLLEEIFDGKQWEKNERS